MTALEVTEKTIWTADAVASLNAHYAGRSPEALLDWATEHFGSEIVLTCSFGGAAGMVLLDMIVGLGRNTPVVFLDTDLLFPETYALADEVDRRYGIAVERRHPVLNLEQQEHQHGSQLYAHNPDKCCAIRKVAPLADALRPYSAWISGIRRDQSATRASTELFQWNTRYELLKISPLAYWSERDVWSYIHKHDVPYNKLLDQGYKSLGCAPCTQASNSSDSRAGRWAGFAKTECGIHL